MYHTLTLWSLVISMTWIWVIVSIITFLSVVARESKKHAVINYWIFFRYSPFIIITAYLIWAWARYFTNELIPFPTSIEQILLYISPVWWEFSLLWIIIWVLIACRSFLQKQIYQQTIIRIDIWFKSLCRAMIPLWIFLLLWDAFIGIPTTSSIWVSAIKPDSAVALYNKVLPLGLWISLIGIIGVWFESFVTHWLKPWHWFAWFAWIAWALAYLTLYQQYARRILILVWDIRFDIKQYFLIALAIYFIILRNLYRKDITAHTK